MGRRREGERERGRKVGAKEDYYHIALQNYSQLSGQNVPMNPW